MKHFNKTGADSPSTCMYMYIDKKSAEPIESEL